jgi:hypothetical protein
VKGAWARSGGTGVCTGDVHAASGSRQARRLAGRQGSQAGRLAGKRAGKWPGRRAHQRCGQWRCRARPTSAACTSAPRSATAERQRGRNAGSVVKGRPACSRHANAAALQFFWPCQQCCNRCQPHTSPIAACWRGTQKKASAACLQVHHNHRGVPLADDGSGEV